MSNKELNKSKSIDKTLKICSLIVIQIKIPSEMVPSNVLGFIFKDRHEVPVSHILV